MYWFQYNNKMYRAGYCTTSLSYFSLHKHRNDRCIELRIDIIWVYDFVYYMSNTFAYPHIIHLNTQQQYTEPDIALLESYYRLSPLTYFSLHKHRKDRCIELRIEAVLSICTDQSVIFPYT